MIYCNECGKEISDKADKCPHCGCPVFKNTEMQNQIQKSKEGKISGLSITALVFSILGCTFFIGVILAIIDLCIKDGRKKTCSIISLVISGVWLFLAIGLQSSSDDSKTNSNNNVLENVQENNNAQDSKKEFLIGEVAEYKDVKITVINYEESMGNDWGKPSEGNVFIFPEIEITNNSNKEISVSSIMSFECYIDDYKADFNSDAFMAISTEDGKQQLDGSIAPGKKLKGVLGIEAPNDWKTIEIYYKDNVWLSSNFSFKIIK